ncbi:uncharacterized protein LOC116256790 isoform X2 [Nymphaea colorata]|uniref:uncharacterized protein LOC116256790 isoform X2 n=1 Tax=Nymphaea colorata TaxID=210225 RepID=UPI00214E80D6|nr:uncharacterized protein LOC116256790 isoform X2 [Nymphaea colorata]
MAEAMGTQKDAVLDTGSASKTENVPIQVTSIRLTKDNYLSWSAALEIGITSRGRLSYITGDKPAPIKSDPQWATWALEDSQVKVWIISSVSSDIQPLILRKPTSFDMWTVLAKMYGRKKRHLRTYQIKRSIYSLTQGDLSVAAFYAALKTKWEELDYHVTDEWTCGSDHSLYWEKEWMDRTFLFLGGLRDEFESIRSQILNGDEIPGIEEVYARVESEEQRRQVMHLDTGHGPSAFVSRASGTGQRPARHCTHCHKLGHSVDFCWDLHPEKRLVRGRPPSGKRSPSVSDSSQSNSSSGAKSKLSPAQLKELQAYISRLSTNPEESSTSEGAQLAQALVASTDQGNPSLGDWIVDSGATHHMTGDSKLFQEYQLSSGKQRVSMADGSSISVAGKGSLSLLNKYRLHNALHVPNIPVNLHVPNIPVNLLSVSSITKELNCNLIFSADHCSLQDLVTGKKIGIGSVTDGLYRLPITQQGEKINLRHFKPIKPLGCGDTGSVHLVELKGTGELYAMKAMDKSTMLNRNKVHRACVEREIISMLDHPFLPTLYTSFQTATHVCLITDFCPGGELFALLDKQPMKVLKEDAVRFYAAEVVVGLEYLHCLGVIYRDLKPENILLQRDGHILLTDFDLSFLTSCKPQIVRNSLKAKKRRSRNEIPPTFLAEPTTQSNSFVGTEEYIAPEIITGTGHSSAIDWWALGILLYEMLYGRTPFRGKNRQKTFANILHKDLTFPSSVPVSLEARQLIHRLLHRDPISRLGSNGGANEIKQHPFFRGINWPLIRCMMPPQLDVPIQMIRKESDTFDWQWEDDKMFFQSSDIF